jgi:IS5 family transposase
VCGDACYTGVDKRPEHQDRKMIWSIAARPSSYKKHAKKSLIGRMRRKIEYAKAQVPPGVRIVVTSPNFPENAYRGRKETGRAVLFT